LKHKQVCKQRSAEIWDKALVKIPLAKESCPIFFLPLSVFFYLLFASTRNFADEHELANRDTGLYYSCCGTKLKQGVTTPVFHLES
jgi:hypothetical protein